MASIFDKLEALDPEDFGYGPEPMNTTDVAQLIEMAHGVDRTLCQIVGQLEQLYTAAQKPHDRMGGALMLAQVHRLTMDAVRQVGEYSVLAHTITEQVEKQLMLQSKRHAN
jgi:hypothetical protein